MFDDKTKPPEDRDVATALGPASGPWKELAGEIAKRFAPLEEDWVFSGKKYGWSLRLRQKKRSVLYMTPCEGYFRVSFALGEKAQAQARGAKLPASVKRIVETAPKFPEGRAVRLEVRNARDVRSAVRIAEIKMSN